MKSFAVQKIPFGLSLTALLATFIALQVFDRITDAVDIPASAFFSVPLVASLTAFIFSAIGLHLLTRKNLSPKIAALWGFGLGMGAFLCVFLPTLFLTLPPSYYQHIVGTLIVTAFTFGGFLAPLFGAITGYWMAKRRDKSDS